MTEHAKQVCKKKAVFKTRDYAWNYALGLFKKHGWLNQPYTCHVCKKFHLTHHFAGSFPKKHIERFDKWYAGKA